MKFALLPAHVRFHRTLASLALCAIGFGLKATTTFARPDQHAPLAAPQSVTPWLGIGIEKGKNGVLVTRVMPGTPAEEASLAVGDEITAIQGRKVSEPSGLIAAVRTEGVGIAVRVSFLRQGQTLEKTIKLAAKPDDLALLRQRFLGRPAPVKPVSHIAGPKISSLEMLKGKVALVEFWATWCPSCRATHPRLSALQKKHGDKLAIVAISNEEEKLLSDYVQKAELSFTVLQDASGALHQEYFVQSIPMILVLDRDGIVSDVTIGAGVYLEEAIAQAEKLLAAGKL